MTAFGESGRHEVLPALRQTEPRGERRVNLDDLIAQGTLNNPAINRGEDARPYTPIPQPPSSDTDWAIYRTLLAVLDEGSLSAAARNFGLKQPTVVRHVDALEAALVVRSQRCLEPTDLPSRFVLTHTSWRPPPPRCSAPPKPTGGSD